jgi:hypothetical protein
MGSSGVRDAVELHSIDGYRLRYVLDLMATHRLEAEQSLIANMIEHGLRYRDASRIRKLLKARCYIYCLAMTIFTFDNHVSKMHPNAHINAPLRWNALIALRHLALQIGGAFNRINYACKLRQQPVAH